MGLPIHGFRVQFISARAGGERANILSTLVSWIRASLKASAEEHHIRKAIILAFLAPQLEDREEPRGPQSHPPGVSERQHCGTRPGFDSVTQHLGLKLQQLPHETEVGGDDSPTLLNKVKGLVQPYSVALNQVCQADGG